jgi:hypothetical protein
MTNLKKGTIDIDGFKILPKINLYDVTENIPSTKIKEIKINETSTAIRFLDSVKLGSKKFLVKIFFNNDNIKGIDLQISDSSINEWDFEELMRQHGEWLGENIGFPDASLGENSYDWGSITQWYDPRARDAGIRIRYN